MSILNFQATEQPTRTENNPTDFCGGTTQLDPKTGVPSLGHRVLLTQWMTFHAKIPQGKPQSRRCEPCKSHLRGKCRGNDIHRPACTSLFLILISSSNSAEMLKTRCKFSNFAKSQTHILHDIVAVIKYTHPGVDFPWSHLHKRVGTQKVGIHNISPRDFRRRIVQLYTPYMYVCGRVG